MSDVDEKLADHEDRLRDLESAIAVLPSIDKKLDRLLEKGLDTDVAVFREQIDGHDEDIDDLSETVDELKEQINKWKHPIAILMLLITVLSVASLSGADASTILQALSAGAGG